MENIIKNLEKNNMQGFYFKTTAELLEFVRQLLPENAKIASGGSQSLIDSGVLALLKSGKYCYSDRDSAASAEEQKQVMINAFTSDYYFCSTNALTENGELVNVDGRSNRCAAIMFGPENVIMIVGKNKIVKNVSDGFERIKKIAAPKNTLRLNCSTYCKENGVCVAAESSAIASGCASPQRICCSYVVSAHQREKGRIKVLICEQDLGF